MRAVVLIACLGVGCGRLGFDDVGDDDNVVSGDAKIIDVLPVDVPTVPVTFTQKSAVGSGVGPHTLSLGSPSVAGTMLVIAMGANSVGSLVLPSGWQVALSTGFSGACYALIAYYPDNPGGIVDVTFDQPTGLPSAAVLIEVAGVTALDATGMAQGTTPVTMHSVSTSASTTTDRTIAVTSFCEDVNNPTYTSGVGWTNIASFSTGAASTSFNADYRTFSSPGVVSETVTSSVTGKYAAVIATFR